MFIRFGPNPVAVSIRRELLAEVLAFLNRTQLCHIEPASRMLHKMIQQIMCVYPILPLKFESKLAFTLPHISNLSINGVAVTKHGVTSEVKIGK